MQSVSEQGNPIPHCFAPVFHDHLLAVLRSSFAPFPGVILAEGQNGEYE